MCQDVYEIDIIEAEDMTKELFENRYDFSGRPVLVKNVTAHWTAMQEFNFEFFRDLYEDLQSPVLDNEDPDCQFLSWGFNFENVQVSSSDNLLPYLLLFEDGNRHSSTVVAISSFFASASLGSFASSEASWVSSSRAAALGAARSDVPEDGLGIASEVEA